MFDVEKNHFISKKFNVKRLKRISSNLGLSYASESNLGSTWYSTPRQIRLVSYLTLIGMAYLNDEEFTPTERSGELEAKLWPYWYHGVLLLYGQNLFMNHLMATKQLDIVKLRNQIDVSARLNISVWEVLHIHTYQDNLMFSKIRFKDGEYDQMSYKKENVTQVNYYALKMALESKRFSIKKINKMFTEQSDRKT